MLLHRVGVLLVNDGSNDLIRKRISHPLPAAASYERCLSNLVAVLEFGEKKSPLRTRTQMR